jgi:phosphoribosyl-ATP pyrophosphohydrolase
MVPTELIVIFTVIAGLDLAIHAAFVAATRLPMSAFTIHDLELRLKDRAAASADVSYTRKLLDRGIAHCAKKLGEEAIETALAAVGEDRERLAEEAADLIYHLLVVLNARGITLAEVEAVLAERTRQSGLDEKASRTRG